MELSQEIFDVLVYIENKQNEIVNIKKIADSCFLNDTVVEEIINLLIDNKQIMKIEHHKYRVTNDGYETLKPYKVKRAILIAAGLGSRMAPITINTPKPLVRVRGKRLIETLIDALLEKDINEIHVVRGYLGEQFQELKEKYPNIQLYTNDKYNKENNISSAMLVKNLYKNAYVMDADLYLANKDIIRKYEYTSNYLGVYTKHTDDWRLIEENNKVIGMKMGGDNCHLMIGLSYWTKEDAKEFKKDIVEVYNQPSGKSSYWDDVVLGNHNNHYHIKIRQCHENDIIEIDSFEELKKFDPNYA